MKARQVLADARVVRSAELLGDLDETICTLWRWEWCDFVGELAATEPTINMLSLPGVAPGNVGDPTKRRSITGPCSRDWRDAFRHLYAERHSGAG